MTKSTSASPQAGFTLIEVLIVTLLLIFISIATFQSVRSTIQAKEEIDFKAEILQEGRAVFAIMSRDISLAYYSTPEDFIWEAPPAPNPVPSDYVPPQPTGPKPIPVTMFSGKENEMFFSSKSHQRTYSESPENEMHYVTYQLHGKELVRGESFRAVSERDREDAKEGSDKFRIVTVLEDVRSFKLGYWDSRSEKWADQWDTEKPEYKDRLPLAVKIDIEYMPDYDPSKTRRKIETIKISSAVRITETEFRSNGAQANGATGNSTTTGPNGGPPVGGTFGTGFSGGTPNGSQPGAPGGQTGRAGQ